MQGEQTQSGSYLGGWKDRLDVADWRHPSMEYGRALTTWSGNWKQEGKSLHPKARPQLLSRLNNVWWVWSHLIEKWSRTTRKRNQLSKIINDLL